MVWYGMLYDMVWYHGIPLESRAHKATNHTSQRKYCWIEVFAYISSVYGTTMASSKMYVHIVPQETQGVGMVPPYPRNV
jgi:hypothetical protein